MLDTVLSPAKSLFAFRRVEVFDPRFSLTLSSVVCGLCVLFSALLGPASTIVFLPAAVAVCWYVSRTDAHRLNCVSLYLENPVLTHLDVQDDKVTADLLISKGSVARLGRTLGRRAPLAVKPGRRNLPILLATPTAKAAWVESGKLLYLESKELRGALSTILTGDELTVEVLVGSRPDRPPTILGTYIHSSAGSVQTWLPPLHPVLPLDSIVPNYPR